MCFKYDPQIVLSNILLCFFILDHVYEFSFHELSIEVSDWIFEWIFITLTTFAFVASGFETTTENRDTLKSTIIEIICHVGMGKIWISFRNVQYRKIEKYCVIITLTFQIFGKIKIILPKK